jgi:hypothetical protein
LRGAYRERLRGLADKRESEIVEFDRHFDELQVRLEKNRRAVEEFTDYGKLVESSKTSRITPSIWSRVSERGCKNVTRAPQAGQFFVGMNQLSVIMINY